MPPGARAATVPHRSVQVEHQRLSPVRDVQEVEPAVERGRGANRPVLHDGEQREQAVRGALPARPEEGRGTARPAPGSGSASTCSGRLEQHLPHRGLAGWGHTHAHLATGGEQEDGHEGGSRRLIGECGADTLPTARIGGESHGWRAPPACCSVVSFGSCCTRSSRPRIWAPSPGCWPISTFRCSGCPTARLEDVDAAHRTAVHAGHVLDFGRADAAARGRGRRRRLCPWNQRPRRVAGAGAGESGGGRRAAPGGRGARSRGAWCSAESGVACPTRSWRCVRT